MSNKKKPFAIAVLTIKSKGTRQAVRSDKAAKIFVDSGASVTVLPERMASTMESKIGAIPSEHINIQTVGGPKAVRKLKDVELCLGHVCAASDVIVTDGSFGDVAIGADFLTRAKCSIDFDKKIMKCGGKTIKFVMEK